MDQQSLSSDDDSGTVFQQLWRGLIQMVHRRFPWLSPVKIEEAIEEVILQRLTPDDAGEAKGQGELSVASLYGEVCRQVGNSVRADRRRSSRERKYAREKNICYEDDFFVQNGLSAENIAIEEQKDELVRLLEGCNDSEKAIVVLRQQGIKNLPPYVEVLGVGLYPLAEQRRAVCRAWNRLRVKLQRRVRRTRGA
jgi:hypothetical protein